MIKSDTSYINERLRMESSYIKNIFLKINQFTDILANIVENINRLALYKESSHLKDKISTLNFAISLRVSEV